MTDAEKPTVLVVDDEPRLADLFGLWLQDNWTVRTAYDGEEALDQMDERVEIVLLDRRMPGLSGDEVLDDIRETGYDTRVIMVTAVDPDFDIIAMGFDDYVVKPVNREDLEDRLKSVHSRSEYDVKIQEYYALIEKRVLLEGEKSEPELEENDEYQELLARIEELQSDVDEVRANLKTHEDFVGAFRDLDS